MYLLLIYYRLPYTVEGNTICYFSQQHGQEYFNTRVSIMNNTNSFKAFIKTRCIMLLLCALL